MHTYFFLVLHAFFGTILLIFVQICQDQNCVCDIFQSFCNSAYHKYAVKIVGIDFKHYNVDYKYTMKNIENIYSFSDKYDHI